MKPPTNTVATTVFRHGRHCDRFARSVFRNMRRARVEPHEREQQEESEVADFEEIELLRLQACSFQ